jgi:sterol 3beta-glucosyltransferase
VALALALQRRGHRVTFATEARMEGFVRSFGLDWRCIEGDSAGLLFQPEAQKALAESNMWRLISLTTEWDKKFDKSSVLRSYEAALAGADVVVGAGLTMTPSMCVAERLGAAWVPMLLGPTMPTSEFPLFLLAGLACGCRCLNKWTYDVAFKALWAQERPLVNKWRVDHLRLPPIEGPSGVVGVVARIEPPVLIACSRLLCGPRRAVPGDYTTNVQVSGFVFVPTVEESGEAVEPALVAFLARAAADGVPAVYLGFGSMPSAEPAKLLRLAVDVCALLRVRAVVVAGWSGAEASGGTESVLVVRAAPHDWLLKRVKCIVHHAGVGTTAAALRAGVPQVPCPFMLDQPHNAKLVVSLGAAPAAVPYSATLSAATLAAAMERAMDPARPHVAAAARLGEEVRAESAGASDRLASAVEGATPLWGRLKAK